MASEVSYAAQVSAGSYLSTVVSGELHENLYDPTALRSLMVRLPWGAQGSAITRTATYQPGAVGTDASSEISGGFSNTLPSTSYFNCTVALVGLQFAPTDLFHIVGGSIDVAYLISKLVESFELKMTDLFCALFSSVSGSVSPGSGVDLSDDTIFDAMYALNLGLNPASVACVLYQEQVNNLVEALRGATGAMEFRTEVQSMLGYKGQGWRGRFLDVDFWQSDSVPTANAGADSCGSMFSNGAFGYQLADVGQMEPMINQADVLFGTAEMFVERVRDGANSLTKLMHKFYPGVVEIEDARACRIISDR